MLPTQVSKLLSVFGAISGSPHGVDEDQLHHHHTKGHDQELEKESGLGQFF